MPSSTPGGADRPPLDRLVLLRRAGARSIPPVSSTCVLSARVVATPPTVMVTVGATVIGVQLLAGYPLVSKLS